MLGKSNLCSIFVPVFCPAFFVQQCLTMPYDNACLWLYFRHFTQLEQFGALWRLFGDKLGTNLGRYPNWSRPDKHDIAITSGWAGGLTG
jgi:hypothetical protein